MREPGMTVKQIAEAVGKDPATVSRWIQAASCKMQELSCKTQEAKATKKAARYTLAESCQIIEEGMGAAAADVYRTNAVHAVIAARPATTAALVHEVRLSYASRRDAEARVDFLIGYQARSSLAVAPSMAGKRALPAIDFEPLRKLAERGPDQAELDLEQLR